MQNFTLTGQALCHLSQVSGPFGSDYFGDRVLLFAQASLNHNPILQHDQVFSSELGISLTFRPRKAWNHDLPDLSIPCS
jgi:hypothetical protein